MGRCYFHDPYAPFETVLSVMNALAPYPSRSDYLCPDCVDLILTMPQEVELETVDAILGTEG
jgi:hypothetical protein